MIFLLFGISIFSFLIMQLAPGNYLDILKLNPQISKKYIHAMEEKFGLNLPWYDQYYRWIRGILPHPKNFQNYPWDNWRAWWSPNIHDWTAFDFGVSFATQTSVWSRLKPAMFNTFVLAVSAAALSWAIAVPLGVYAAVKQNQYVDQAAVFYSYVGYAIPDFFLAMVLLFLAARVHLLPFPSFYPIIGAVAFIAAILGGFFSLKNKVSFRENLFLYVKGAILTGLVSFLILTGIFYVFQKANLPIGGMTSPDYDFLPPLDKFIDLLRHLILPTVVLAVGNVAYLLRQMRASMLDVLRAEYVTTARAKGLSERAVIFRHAFRNALNPMITLLGFELGFLLSGALAVEIVMSWPGLGWMIYEAIITKDLYVVMGDLMLSSVLLILGNLFADIILAWSDPRIRYG
jgi:peptide/nickel transport system permease protein